MDVGKETGMFDYKLTSPLDINVKLWKGIESPLVNEESFLRLTGRIIYLIHTHPNISFAVNSLCQFMNEPHENHPEARQVVSYVKNTIGMRLLFIKNENLYVEVYTSIDYAS